LTTVTPITLQLLVQRVERNDKQTSGSLKWAACPVVGGASLLFLATDGQGEQAVAAHAAIVEIRRAEAKGPAEAVWTAALEAAGIANDSEAVGRIGFRAHTDGNASTAARAWAMVTAIDDPATEWLRQAAALSRGHRDPTSEIPPRKRLLELTEATYGPDHPEVAATSSGTWAAQRRSVEHPAERTADDPITPARSKAR
jgi:hypothetical protein